MMIKFVVLMCVLAAIRAEDKPTIHLKPAYVEKMVAIGNTCMGQLNADSNALDQLVAGSLPDDDISRKFVYCFVTTMDLANKEGHFNVEMMSLMAEGEEQKRILEKVLTECNKNSGDDKYEVMFRTHKCFHAEVPVLFSMEQL